MVFRVSEKARCGVACNCTALLLERERETEKLECLPMPEGQKSC